MSGTGRAGAGDHDQRTTVRLVRNLWLARITVAAWLQATVIYVPDPTEHLVTMMRDFAVARGGKFVVGVQSRVHDP